MNNIPPPASADELLQIWAPDDSVWSSWVKPVPFAFWPRPLVLEVATLRAHILPEMFPPASAGRAIVLDLPGAEVVRGGMMLAAKGYRPIPIFASCPGAPLSAASLPATVDVDALISALAVESNALATMPLTPEAPPVFLLDACRLEPRPLLPDHWFENRSAVFPGDFPSAAKLRELGISSVLIMRDTAYTRNRDLGHALNHWRRAGMPIEVIDPLGAAASIKWPLGAFATFLHNFALRLKLRRHRLGGYGGIMSESSGG